MRLLYIIYLSLFWNILEVFNQCPNSDFSSGNFSNWTGTCTNYSNSYSFSGVPPILAAPQGNIRHRIHNDPVPVYDPVFCGNVSRTPPGKTWSAQLGNISQTDNFGPGYWNESQIDILEYTVTVSPDNNLLLYHFATVLQEPDDNDCDGVIAGIPTHSAGNRPRLEIEVLEKSTGNLIHPNCGKWEEFADPTSPVIRTCNDITCVYYRAWTTIGVDLRAYENLPAPNNEITLRFKNYDCGYGLHFGYSYVSAECKKLEINVEFCEKSNQAILTAPEGFYYLWQNGASTQTIVWPNPVAGDIVEVQLISMQGCVSILETTLYPTEVSPDFTANKFEECVGIEIQFDDLSTALNTQNNEPLNIIEWMWDFGDGNTSSDQHPSHTYNVPGTYNIQLIAVAETNCKDTIEKQIIIHPKPIADFIVQNGCLGTDIVFTDQSDVLSGNINQWNWNFNNPASPDNTSTNQHPSHIYQNQGNYQPELIVSTDKGCKDTVSYPLTIHPLPEANFSYKDNCAGKFVTFTDESIANSPLIQAWLWNFGDGSALFAGQNPVHNFPATDVYNVQLIVSNSNGCINQVIIPVEIIAFTADFNFDTVCYNQETSFSDISIGNTVQWEWNFGDGTTSIDKNPTHTFSEPGTHEVIFYTKTNEGCESEIRKNILVYHNPITNFNANKYEGCIPLCIEFKDYSFDAEGISGWEWNLDDNQSSYNQNPEFCYSTPGYKDISLIITSIYGCKDSMEWKEMIHVYESPVADFSYAPTKIYIDNPMVTFSNSSIGAESYKWNIDKLGVSYEKDTAFFFPQDVIETYDVCLIAISEAGCIDTVCQEIPILGIYVFLPYNTFTPNNEDLLNDYFIPVIIGADPEHFEFSVYNRWGELLYYTQKLNDPWDGKFKDEIVKEDVYVWEIRTREKATGKQHRHYGHVTVLGKSIKK